MALHAVIMAGGIGSRFWPRSRQDKPKQFLELNGTASLIQNTFARLQPLIKPEQVVIVTHERYAYLTAEHLPAIDPANILAEPASRNTAPAIVYAASMLYARDPDATMIVLPADHLISNVREFQNVLAVAVNQAQQPGALVTIGIEPTYPATGYGYIQFDTDDEASESGAFPVRTFAEKPDVATAERFLDAGDFVWNSGIFIWRADTILDAAERYLPEIRDAFRPVIEAAGTPGEYEAVVKAFDSSEKISIDYGVMERAASDEHVFVVPGNFDWSDVGDWRAVYRLSVQDQAGNVTEGNVITHNAGRSYVYSEQNRLIALVGVKDLIVVDTDDALLICDMQQTQHVKNIVDYLGSHGMDEYI